jgi:hypothetical protein
VNSIPLKNFVIILLLIRIDSFNGFLFQKTPINREKKNLKFITFIFRKQNLNKIKLRK